MKTSGEWYIAEWDQVPTEDIDDLLNIHREIEENINTSAKPYWAIHDDNLILTSGLEEIAKRSLGYYAGSVTNDRFRLGSANTPTPLPTQTDLVAPIRDVHITNRSLLGTTERYFTTIARSATHTNTIGEFGLLSSYVSTRVPTRVVMSRLVVNPRFDLLVGRTYTIMTTVTHSAG